MTRVFTLCPSCLILALVSATAAGAEAIDPDVELLSKANLRTDPKSLLELIRLRTGSDKDLLTLDELIRQMGSRRFVERDEAARRIVLLGPVAEPALQDATKSRDAEIARRASACFQDIKQGTQFAIPTAAVRLLVKRPPPGSLEVLLHYLPYACDQELEAEIWFAVDSLAVRDGKVDPAMEAALASPLPQRRALAACILGRSGNREQLAAVRKVLSDGDPIVRLRAAQGLLGRMDKSGVPTLIALLDEPQIDLSWQAEELLHWTAGDGAPDAVVGSGTAEARKKCRAAWEGWWRQNGSIIDLAAMDKSPRHPILFMVCETAHGFPSSSRVWLAGCDRRARWELKDLKNTTWDAEYLPRGNRVLVAEYDRLTERDLDGKIHWDLKSSRDGCQRLPNGNTFVSMVNGQGFEELDPAGKVFYRRELLSESNEGLTHCWGCRRLANGRVLASIGDKGFIGEFDGFTGREVKRIHIGEQLKRHSRVEALPGGNYLVACSALLEVDGSGKILWQHNVQAITATRLRNGNTLVATQYGDVPGPGPGVFEVNRNGKAVWETFTTERNCSIQNMRLCLPLVGFGFRPK